MFTRESIFITNNFRSLPVVTKLRQAFAGSFVSPRPYGQRLLISFAHFHAHPAELFVEATSVHERPPFVKENFHRTPHGHPTDDKFFRVGIEVSFVKAKDPSG
jgi:hypothetical protein